jgi:hypothetical protein
MNEQTLVSMKGTEAETLPQLMEISQLLASSEMIPANYRGKPQDILAAGLHGKELGMGIMTALKNIAVINGRPAVFGDGLLAICQGKPDFQDIKEEFSDAGMVAICTVVRRGRTPVVRRFSQADATAAGLWKKSGPWTTYPKRMLQMRARAFALRDAYSDAISGIYVAEEAQDMPVEHDITPHVINTESRTETVKNIIESIPEPEHVDAGVISAEFRTAKTESELKNIVEKYDLKNHPESELLKTAYKEVLAGIKKPAKLKPE